MRNFRNSIIAIIIMVIVSVLSLFVVSMLSYTYKWQADKALIGITLTYIMTGFIGGLLKKIIDKEQKKMGRKMLEAMILSSIFMCGLIVLSVFVIQNPLEVSSRFLMIWMLLIGSTCLGRIL